MASASNTYVANVASSPDYCYNQPGDMDQHQLDANPAYPPAYSPLTNLTQPMQQSSNTTVIVNQPTPQSAIKHPRTWSSGTCECFEDIGICLCGCFVPCCLMGQITSDMGESCCVPCCVPGAPIVLRAIWRTKENIEGSVMDDCCKVACCPVCSLCQLARDIKMVKRLNNMAPIVFA